MAVPRRPHYTPGVFEIMNVVGLVVSFAIIGFAGLLLVFRLYRLRR